MQDLDDAIAELGNEPPLIADGRAGPPDRREISARWLTGTFLTGLTSSVLMGVALMVALDGREQLATPPETADFTAATDDGGGDAARTVRVVPPRQIARAKDKRRIEASMMTRVGDRDVVRTMPFIAIKMALAAGHKSNRPYPPFDPLNVFSQDADAPVEPTDEPVASGAPGQIYGAKVEGEISLKTADFPVATAKFDESGDLSTAEVEEIVRSTSPDLTDGAMKLAALHYVDPQRFGDSLTGQALTAAYGVRVVQENVSVAPVSATSDQDLAYAEEIIPFPAAQPLGGALADSGYIGDDAKAIAAAAERELGVDTMPAGTVVNLGFEVRGEDASVVRLSVYDRARHLVTIARNDKGEFVAANQPTEVNPGVLSAFDETPTIDPRAKLPSVYDGIYQTAYSYGMSPEMTQQLVRLLSSDVDFQARLDPSDQIEVFLSKPDDENNLSAESQLLFVSATFAGQTRNFYRYAFDDGTSDYFDEDGRSAKQFLMRNPVPNSVFRSGFGARKHPILGYVKMHTGVDWAAPRGTPILAAGNGVVEKAGWAGGYGRQTILRHANGYETSYNHQSALAKGIEPGVRVRQGQVIGYVGATGLATGDHLHFEVIVNGTKVDPMRVRLPNGRGLDGADLARFKAERDRIDQLMKDDAKNGSLKVASAKPES